MLVPSRPKKQWKKPDVVIMLQDAIEKDSAQNLEVHTGHHKITVGGNPVPANITVYDDSTS